MRLPTRKLDKGYLHKFYRLDVENKSIIISELEPYREGYNLAFRTKDNDNCISINRKTGEVVYHGRSKRLLQTALAISGCTYELEELIRSFGFKYSYIGREYMRAVATQQ